MVPSFAQAQHEYDVWQFGANWGLDFRSVPPTATTSTMSQEEGCASICDRRTGSLLFYSDGVTVWNRNNVPMPNGTGLLGHWSSAQSALIVPSPCDTSHYYLFTTGEQGYFYGGTYPIVGSNYSIIDMRLNGGLGDVIAKNTPLQNPVGERQVAVAHANGRDYWIVLHSVAGNTFYAWQINGSGVAPTPVVSVAGVYQGDSSLTLAYGILKASPNGRKLAMTTLLLNMAETFDFDPATGRVTAPILLYQGPRFGTGNGPYCYGITFSPNSKLVYHAKRGDLVQYDITLPTPAAIAASQTVIVSSPGTAPAIWGSLQIGPDGKIYSVNDTTFNMWIGCIANPNVVGQGCAYTAGWLRFIWNAIEPLGLPNNIDARYSYMPATPSSIFLSGPNPHCVGDSVVLTPPFGYTSYEWSTGARTRSIKVDSTATYSVIMTDALGCIVHVATEIVVLPRPTPEIIPLTPTTVCEGDVVQLQVDSLYAAYRWSDGSTGREVSVRTGGIWRVTVTDSAGCRGVDSIFVNVVPAPRPVIGGAGKLCFGDSTTLDPGGIFLRYLWSTGDTTRTIRVTGSANYSVTVWDSTGCIGTSPVAAVIMKDSIIPSISPSGTIELCEGDSALIITGGGYARYSWSNGGTGQSISVRDSGLYQVRAYDADGCSGQSGIVRVIVHGRPPIPTIALVGDTLVASTSPNYTWRYNGQVLPNAITDRLLSMGPGIYTVTTTDTNSCASPSAPYRIITPHIAWLDTVSTRVGERVFLTMRVAPPIEQREMLTRYHLELAVDPTSLFIHGLLDPPGTNTAATRPTLLVGRDGSIVIDRFGDDPISGSELFRLECEGLSTGIPINIVPILSLLVPESDSVRIVGNGLVILAGCDIAHGFRFGKKVHIDKVVPNPAHSGEIVVAYHAPLSSRPLLVIVDASGHEILQRELTPGTADQQEVQLDPSTLSSGVYHVQLHDRTEQATVTMVVIR